MRVGVLEVHAVVVGQKVEDSEGEWEALMDPDLDGILD